jgi:hypothetical protein
MEVVETLVQNEIAIATATETRTEIAAGRLSVLRHFARSFPEGRKCHVST